MMRGKAVARFIRTANVGQESLWFKFYHLLLAVVKIYDNKNLTRLKIGRRHIKKAINEKLQYQKEHFPC